MFQRVIGTIIVLAGGNFGGGRDANITVVPSFVITCSTVSINIERLTHRGTSPFQRVAVYKTVFVRILFEPLPIDVLGVIICIKTVAIGGIYQIAGIATVVLAGTGGSAETATRGAVASKTRHGLHGVARVSSLVSGNHVV